MPNGVNRDNMWAKLPDNLPTFRG